MPSDQNQSFVSLDLTLLLGGDSGLYTDDPIRLVRSSLYGSVMVVEAHYDLSKRSELCFRKNAAEAGPTLMKLSIPQMTLVVWQTVVGGRANGDTSDFA